VTFRVAWRGYDRENVDHYLRRVARGRPDDR
jgi:DivIVA domain-containing protein